VLEESKVVDYHNPPRITRDEALKIFSDGTDEKICDALLSIAFYDVDWKWGQSQCLYFLNHSNPEIRGLAAVCLGHIARIHHKLDKSVVVTALKGRLSDPEISGRVQDALDDIEMFLD
jgi:hypothetical protein